MSAGSLSLVSRHSLTRQVLDVLDCSGSGDVDTSTEVEATDGRVTGVFGERLSLNSSWHNPSGMYTCWKSRTAPTLLCAYD